MARLHRVDAMERIAKASPLLLVATLMAGALMAVLLLPRDGAADLAAGLMIVLAGAGAFGVLAFAAGLIRFGDEANARGIAEAICDAVPDAIVATDEAGRTIYANAAYARLCGVRRTADAPAVLTLLSGASGADAYRLAQAARNGESAEVEIDLRPAGHGDPRRYAVALQRIGDAARRGNLYIFADRAEPRRGDDRAAAALDRLAAGLATWSADGAVTFVNATLTGWLGKDRAEIAALADLVAGDGAARLAACEAGSAGIAEIDLDFARRDGKALPMRMLLCAGGPAEAQRFGIVAPRAAAPPRDEPAGVEEVRFARIFNATPMAIAIVDRGGAVSRSNAAFARLLPDALKQGGARAGSIYAGILERDRAALAAALRAAAASGADIAPVDVALAGDGDRSARLFVSALDEPGEPGGSGATIYALDTTEQRTLQTNFAQSQKMQAVGQLAGGVAHDFNNVLTAIIGYSDLLLANHRPTDPSFRDIMQIKQNANRAAGLVRQLLAFSRRQTLRPQILRLGDDLSDLQAMMRRLVGEKIDLDLRHGRDLWMVKADRNQFEQVIINLIVNARDAMPDGGRIILRTRNVTPSQCAELPGAAVPPADYVAIEVEDFGHGIAPEVKDKIFEPFFTTKDVGKGTGLGLAMVYGIVKQTGGYVFCDSAVGRGATFTLLLPRYIPTAADDPPPSAPARAPADLTGQGTILLVEDEEAVRAFAARALASRGYRVLQAASGLEALAVAEENAGSIDLVVSDVVMPEMDGPTLLGELRRRGILAKVVFVSGYAEEAFAKNLPEGEDFAFLPKPFSLKQLVEAVKAAVA